jgi:hypothetical protein
MSLRHIPWADAIAMPECREKLDSGEWVLFKKKLPSGDMGYRVTDFGCTRAERERKWKERQARVERMAAE